MPKVAVIVNRPADTVWEFFTTPGRWEQWWGGALRAVEPDWEEGARMMWALGTPSPIVTLRHGKELRIEDAYLTTAFRFTKASGRATRVEIEFEPRGGASFHDGGASHAERTNRSLAAFKRLVEAETDSPDTEGRAPRWQFWKR